MHKYNQIVTECFVYFSHKPPKHACKASGFSQSFYEEENLR